MSATKLDSFTRQACIAALRSRSARTRILHSYATSPVTPRPVEVGLDPHAALRAACAAHRRIARDAILAIALGGVVWILLCVAFEPSAPIAAVILLLAVYVCSSVLYAKWVVLRERELVPNFWPERYGREEAHDLLRSCISPYAEDTGSPHQNLTVHNRSRQFVGFGLEISDWKMAIDIQRGAGGAGTPEDLDATEVLSALSRSLQSGRANGREVRHHYFLDGAVLPDVVELAPTTIGRVPPVVPASLEAAWRMNAHDAPARQYLLCQTLLARDLVQTYAIRALAHGRYLTIEVHNLVLPPIRDIWAQTLHCGRRLPDNWTTYFWSALLRGPYEHLLAAAQSFDPTGLKQLDFDSRNWTYPGVIPHPPEDIKFASRRLIRYFNWRAWNDAGSTMNGRQPDFGCHQSIREALASDTIGSYAVREDLRLHSRLMDKEVLDCLRDTLKAKGIATDDFDEARNTIINSGVFIQDGNLNAASVAVGAGSSSVANSNRTKVVGQQQNKAARRRT